MSEDEEFFEVFTTTETLDHDESETSAFETISSNISDSTRDVDSVMDKLSGLGWDKHGDNVTTELNITAAIEEILAAIAANNYTAPNVEIS